MRSDHEPREFCVFTDPAIKSNRCSGQVLQNTVERVIRPADDQDPSSEVPLGLYIVRGENVCTVGLVDEAIDDSINWTEVRGAAIGTTHHS